MTTTLAAPPMHRHPYRCNACGRSWCVFAAATVIVVRGCPFCGVRRFEAMAVVPLERRGGER